MRSKLIIDAPIMGRKEIFVKKVQKPYFDHPFHFHQFCELVWIEKSFGKLIVGDYIGNYEEGELILQAPKLPHLMKCDDLFYQDNNQYFTKAYGIYFPPDYVNTITDDVESIWQYNELLLKAQRGMKLHGKVKEKIIPLIKKMIHSKNLERLGHFLSIIHLLGKTTEYELLASVGYKSMSNEEDISRFDAVYQYLLENFQSEITLEAVSKKCNMTPNAFCRYFKNKTQKTLTLFLNELRIGHACKLLQEDNSSIQNICYDCGYNNPVNFFKFFKTITHKTPSQYRKDFIEVHNQ